MVEHRNRQRNEDTKDECSIDDSQSSYFVNAFYVDGEVLNTAQDIIHSSMLFPLGITSGGDQLPEALGTRSVLPVGHQNAGFISKHYMESVINSLEYLKSIKCKCKSDGVHIDYIYF